MEFGQLMIDILVYVSYKFEMYIFKIAQVISENVRIAFLYVLSILECAGSRARASDGLIMFCNFITFICWIIFI